MDHYEFLGVSRDALPETIRAAADGTRHEIVTSDAPPSEGSRLNIALLVLLDPERRRRYDDDLADNEGPERVQKRLDELRRQVREQMDGSLRREREDRQERQHQEEENRREAEERQKELDRRSLGQLTRKGLPPNSPQTIAHGEGRISEIWHVHVQAAEACVVCGKTVVGDPSASWWSPRRWNLWNREWCRRCRSRFCDPCFATWVVARKWSSDDILSSTEERQLRCPYCKAEWAQKRSKGRAT